MPDPKSLEELRLQAEQRDLAWARLFLEKIQEAAARPARETRAAAEGNQRSAPYVMHYTLD